MWVTRSKVVGTMRLHDFILTRREEILVEWETFARICAPAGSTMDVEALRDHASEMLSVMAADLETEQGEVEQLEKSRGHAPDTFGSALTAAEEHGVDRAESGFATEQLVAEYRALRASVLRLWSRERGELDSADLADLTRFNEAIDQALAESVSEFTKNVDNAREMFLAVLGHDLRNPLGAILISADFMTDTGEMDPILTSQIAESAGRATQMVGDLLDFTRSRLGGGIPIHRAEVDLRKIANDVVDEVRAALPETRIKLEPGQGQNGHWDAARIHQALANLVGNAAEHSTPGTAVRVELAGGAEDVAVTIHNQGDVISADVLVGLFNPMKVKSKTQKAIADGPTGHLGLGLYIAERIVHAHGGRIEVESSEGSGTTFTIHLKRA